jgi:hypothetical protein
MGVRVGRGESTALQLGRFVLPELLLGDLERVGVEAPASELAAESILQIERGTAFDETCHGVTSFGSVRALASSF